MIKVHYTHVWKCHNKTHYFVQLMYTDKKMKKSFIKHETHKNSHIVYFYYHACFTR
jgi:hypothetical protein